MGAESVSLYAVNQTRDIAWSMHTVSLDGRVQYTNQVDCACIYRLIFSTDTKNNNSTGLEPH
jgi:hypothetical protein